MNVDSKRTSLTFVTRAGTTVTCNLDVYSTHDTDARYLNAYNQTRRSDGANVPECDGTQLLQTVFFTQCDLNVAQDCDLSLQTAAK